MAIDSHLLPMINFFNDSSSEGLPLDWEQKGHVSVQGLDHVGFLPDSENLIVFLSGARNVYDCESGELITRVKGEYEIDFAHLTSDGIGPFMGKKVQVAGFLGGGLPLYTDSWGIHLFWHNWPSATIILHPKKIGPYSHFKDCFKVNEVVGFRACGFSHSGKSFVLATISDLYFYGLKN